MKKEDANDVDALLTILTKKRGKILVRAKGVRKNESKLKGFIEPFSFGSFLLARSRSLTDVLAGAEEIKNFKILKSDVSRMAVAFYISEVLDKLLVIPEKDLEMWDFVIRVFETLNNKKYQPLAVKVAFERRLLENLGYGSDFKRPILKIQQLADEPINSYKFLSECLK